MKIYCNLFDIDSAMTALIHLSGGCTLVEKPEDAELIIGYLPESEKQKSIVRIDQISPRLPSENVRIVTRNTIMDALFPEFETTPVATLVRQQTVNISLLEYRVLAVSTLEEEICGILQNPKDPAIMKDFHDNFTTAIRTGTVDGLLTSSMNFIDWTEPVKESEMKYLENGQYEISPAAGKIWQTVMRVMYGPLNTVLVNTPGTRFIVTRKTDPNFHKRMRIEFPETKIQLILTVKK